MLLRAVHHWAAGTAKLALEEWREAGSAAREYRNTHLLGRAVAKLVRATLAKV